MSESTPGIPPADEPAISPIPPIPLIPSPGLPPIPEAAPAGAVPPYGATQYPGAMPSPGVPLAYANDSVPGPADAIPFAAPAAPQYPYGPPQAGYPVPPPGYPIGFGAAGLPLVAPRPAPYNRLLPILVIVLAAAYALVCAFAEFELTREISLSNQLDSAYANSTDSAGALSQQLSGTVSLVNNLYLATFVLLIGMLIALRVWRMNLAESLRGTGQYAAVMRKSGYNLLMVCWGLSMVVGLVSNISSNNGDGDVMHAADGLLVYYALRIVFGLVVVVLCVRAGAIAAKAHRAMLYSGNTPVGF